MRVHAALLILACTCQLHAHRQTRPLQRVLNSILEDSDDNPVGPLITCSKTLGPSKCFAVLGVWRAERALKTFAKEKNAHFNLTADVKRFSWKDYSNSSDEQLYSQLCDGTQRLLHYRPLSLTVSGHTIALESDGNGILNVDVLKSNETESGRGSMKKMHKAFYKIVPFLMVPGLIMAAILPFILPALKMMVLGVGMLNNMALTGAIFTLLRNNAFNDKYDHKVIYANDGYKNEHAYEHYEEPHPYEDQYEVHQSDDSHENSYHADVGFDAPEIPFNSDWIKENYSGKKYVAASGYE